MSTLLKQHIITGICGICLLLTACNHGLMVYRADVQQGNYITTKMRKQVHLGMTKNEVEEILGYPILVDTFNNNRFNYVYSFRTKKGLINQSKLTLVFRGGTVARIISGK